MEAACVTTHKFVRREPDSLPGSVPQSRRRVQADPVLTAAAYVLNLGRALRDRRPRDTVAGVCTEELLHAVVALYDSGLPNVGSDGLYSTVCAKGTQTIMLLRNKEEATESYARRSLKGAADNPGSTVADGDPSGVHSGLVDIVPDEVTAVRAAGADSGECAGAADPATGGCGTGGSGDGNTAPDEEAASKFAEVYSDTDSSEGSSSSSEEEEDFSGSIDQFLHDVRRRRREREAAPDDIGPSTIGVECCLLSALTYTTSRTTSGEKVFLLQLMATRKRFRKYGLGRFLLQMLKELMELWQYDAILVHADSGAVSFFTHHRFSDDVILNSKFKEYSDDWVNTTMMSYFPEYCAGRNAITKEEISIDVKKMDLDIKFWRDRSLAAYQAQAVCITRMKKEILSLRDQLLTQKKHIETLETQLQLSHEEKSQLRMESASCRLLAVEKMHLGIGQLSREWMDDGEDNARVVLSTQHTDDPELLGAEHETPPSPSEAGVLAALMGALGTWDAMKKGEATCTGMTAGAGEAAGVQEVGVETRDPAVGHSGCGSGEDASCDEFKWSAL
ncbi:uncharacterized protein LOC144942009 [Lampetra fluviatilis]